MGEQSHKKLPWNEIAQWAMLIVTAFGVLWAGTSGNNALRESKRANLIANDARETANKTLVVQTMSDLRPYVWVDWGESDRGSHLRYSFKNTGKSIAHNFESKKKLSEEKNGFLTCESNSDVFSTIYPGEVQHSGYPLNQKLDEQELYLFNLIRYEYRIPSSESDSSVVSFFRTDTYLLQDLYPGSLDDVIVTAMIGSAETLMYGRVESCSVFFKHPEYFVKRN